MKTVLLTLSILSLAVALQVYPPIVEADTPFQLDVTSDLSNGPSSVDAKYDSFSLVLGIKRLVDNDLNNACVLKGPRSLVETMDNNTFVVSIPDGVGPSGEKHTIATIRYNSADTICQHLNDSLQSCYLTKLVDLKLSSGVGHDRFSGLGGQIWRRHKMCGVMVRITELDTKSICHTFRSHSCISTLWFSPSNCESVSFDLFVIYI